MASKITSQDNQTNYNTVDCLSLINTQKDFLDEISVDLAKLEALITILLKSETLNFSEAILHEYLFILDAYIKSADKQVDNSLSYLNELSKKYNGQIIKKDDCPLPKSAESRYL